MCGRFVLIPEDLKNRFGIDEEIMSISPNYNVSPGQIMPIVMLEQDIKVVQPMEWGLVPHWAKERRPGYSMINARIETIREKPTYKHPFRHHRCIVPATGFYEWYATGTGKQPYYIHPERETMFGFAGLFDTWEDTKNARTINTYTIITAPARGAISRIHDRMPVILKPQYEDTWLREDDENTLFSVLQDNVTDLSMYPVSTRVNTPRNNDMSLIEPITI